MKHFRAFACLVAATLALFGGRAWAQEAQGEERAARLYVDDKLVLNVYAEPAQGGERVATIETGDAVEELERSEDFVRVRLADGREGWVGANYLTSEAPAVLRLRELQREKPAAPAADKKTTEELARLRKQNATLESELKALKESAAAAPPPPPLGETQSFDELEGEPRRVESSDSQDESSGALGLVLVALLSAVAAALAGFAAGYHMLARRLRKKFGGLKIY